MALKRCSPLSMCVLMSNYVRGWCTVFVSPNARTSDPIRVSRYLGVAEAAGNAQFIDVATTTSAFPMVIRPKHLKPSTCGPVLMDKGGKPHRIAGEIWRVDDRCLEAHHQPHPADSLAPSYTLTRAGDGHTRRRAFRALLQDYRGGASFPAPINQHLAYH